MATASEYTPGVEEASPRAEAPSGLVPLKSAPSVNAVSEHLERLYVYFSVYGGAFFILGLIALVLSIAVYRRISASEMIAWMLVIGGLLALLQALLLSGFPSSPSFWALGILHLVLGLWLLLDSTISHKRGFIWLLTLWFLIHGFLKAIASSQIRIVNLWPSLLATGVASIILGFINLGLAPSYGHRLTSILFGVDLLVSSLCFLLVAYSAYLDLAIPPASMRDPLIPQLGFAAASSA